MCWNDIRVFKDYKSGTWIVANDNKKRRLMNQGMSRRKAKKESHGHMYTWDSAIEVKEDILANRRTKKRDVRTLGCYVRCCDKTYRHYNWVCGLHNTKRNQTEQEYYNVRYI